MSADDIAWTPYGYYKTTSNLARFMDRYDFEEYDDLIPETDAEIAHFWECVFDHVDVVWEEAYDTVLDTSGGPQFATWFAGGTLNATASLLDRWAEKTPDALAYVWEGERGGTETLTYRSLARRTNRVANGLRAHGVGHGDVVAIVFPLHPNAIAAGLACLKIGAIQTHVFAGYGTAAIRDRLADSGADVVFIADGYSRDGAVIDLRSKIDDAVRDISDVETIVTYEHLGIEGTITATDGVSWEAFTSDHDPTAEATVVDAEDPALIAYSSGTTGTPKGTIHPQTSLLANGAKQVHLQFDVGGDDTFMWVTDFGWIVVPAWLMGGAQLVGATTVLPGGSPMYPNPNRLWELVERHEVTTLGIAPTGVRQLRQANEAPRKTHDLSSLRILGSTGEPWDEETWLWHFDAVGGGHLPVVNESGGTETCGGLLGVTPLTPLKPGTLYGPAPGVPANVYDADGRPSERGYLVVEGPVPGMTRSLTDGDDRYLDEYWSDFEGVWNHNDWVEIDEDGFWFITGRADDTMNVSGRRITAPTIEAVILEHPDVEDAAAVAVPHDVKGEVPVAFVTLSDGDVESIESTINESIAAELGPMFTLEAVHVVSSIPRTQTGKKPRTLIERTYLGNPPEDTSSLDGGDVLSTYPRRQ